MKNSLACWLARVTCTWSVHKIDVESLVPKVIIPYRKLLKLLSSDILRCQYGGRGLFIGQPPFLPTTPVLYYPQPCAKPLLCCTLSNPSTTCHAGSLLTLHKTDEYSTTSHDECTGVKAFPCGLSAKHRQPQDQEAFRCSD